MPKITKAQLTKKPAFGRLKKLLSQTGKRDLLWYHRVGEQVNRLCPVDDRGYGQSRIQNLATTLEKPESYSDTLWKTRSFYEKYDRPDVRALCKPKTPGGFALSWSHMLHLLSLNDDDRLEFQEDCLSAEWSCKELHRRIKESREPQSQGGRRFRKPKSVEDALRQLICESETWDQRYRQVWFNLDDPAIRHETGKGKSEGLVVLASAAVDELKTLQFNIESCLPQLKQLAAWHKKKKGQRAKKRR